MDVELNKKTIRRIFLGAAGCIVLYWLLHETARVTSFIKTVMNILSPFILGAVLAFIMNVPMRAVERMLKGIKKPGLRRGLSVLLTFLAVVVVIVGVFQLLVPQLVETIESLIESLPAFFIRVKDSVSKYLEENPELLEWLNKNTDFETIDWSGLLQSALTWISSGLTTILDGAFSAVIELANGIFNFVLSLVFCLYCLSRKEILARQCRRMIYAFLPEKICDETVRILRMANATFSNFISGQCLEALILGVMFAISMSIFRLPYMPLVSVIIAVTALVPIIGAFAGCILGAFFILVQNPAQAVFFVIMFLVLQQIEGNLIYPKVVGTSIGLPGMWVLVAVSVGGDLMGVGGMLLMVPLASVLYALMRELTDKRLAARRIDRDKVQDHPPELKSKFKKTRKTKKQKKTAQVHAERKDPE